jgi:nicotinamidase-related amidase
MSNTNESTSHVGLESLLTPDNCVLVLIDHQPYQFVGVQSADPQLVLNNSVALAKTAKAFGVPTILTTVLEERGGYLVQELQDVFPEQTPIDRTSINTWEDPRVVNAVEATGRNKLIMAGLFTEICLVFPVIQALGEGYEAFAVTDASAGVSTESHERAVQRMVQAGAVRITWMAVLAELQRDWARQETTPAVAEILHAHGGNTGVALAWEMQLLAAGVK